MDSPSLATQLTSLNQLPPILPSDATLPDIITTLNNLNSLLASSHSKNVFQSQTEEELATEIAALRQDADILWVLLTGYLVFFMHAGFSMLEVGSVRHKNAVNIMFKNVGTVAFGGVFYFLLGYGFAYGEENADEDSHKFIGSGFFANDKLPRDREHLWFFQFAFAATGATIVSGAVAGRVQLIGYFIIAAYMTSFVYPVVSHWIWATGGWASGFTPREDTLFGSDSGNGCGVLDFAGSGVVHMVGGVTAFYGALLAGPRSGRFVFDASTPEKKDWLNGSLRQMLIRVGFRAPGTVAKVIRPHNMSLVTLGTLILWFGWYGFNSGSTLLSDGKLAAKAAVTTTLSPSAAVVTGTILSRVLAKHYDLTMVLNCALAGLVSITAGCVVVDDWAAVVIGIFAAFVYTGGSKFMEFVGVDDPVDAVAVHGFSGFWGVLAVGIFGTPELIHLAYSDREYCRGWETGLQFGSQLVGTLAIFGWVTLTTVPAFLLLQHFNFWRVSPMVEHMGLDHSEHGGQSAYVGRDSLADEERETTPLDPNGKKKGEDHSGKPIIEEFAKQKKVEENQVADG